MENTDHDNKVVNHSQTIFQIFSQQKCYFRTIRRCIKIEKKKIGKKLKKRLKRISIFLSIFPYNHGKVNIEIQFRADFPIISCGEKKYWKKD